MSDIRYTAKNLAEIADTFEIFASDQIAAKRWQKTAKGKVECDVQAKVWRDAAEILRNTDIKEG